MRPLAESDILKRYSIRLSGLSFEPSPHRSGCQNSAVFVTGANDRFRQRVKRNVMLLLRL